MAARAPSSATYQDLLRLPEGQIGQILDGELVALPRPAARHQAVSSALGGELHSPFSRGRGGPGGWILLDEPELQLGGQVIVPDLVGWRRERLPELPDTPAITLRPDWVCEVLSPSSVSIDRVKKTRIYAKLEIPCFWVVDPLAHTLEVLGLRGDKYAYEASFEGDDPIAAPPFEAVPLELGALWAR